MGKQQNHPYLYQLKNVDFHYKLGSCTVEAVKNLNLDIPSRSLTTISGPSGSGKSTLLNLLGLIEPLQSGEIVFRDDPLAKMSPKQMNDIRKYKIGFIFQQFHLIPVFSAEENISYFLERQGLAENEIKKTTKEALESVGLWEHRFKKPSEMSGGQRQRVAIARALAKKPEVIIGDEPTANLDQVTGREIMEIFDKLVKEHNVSVVLTTHDAMVQSYANLNLHMQDGRLCV